MADDIKFMDAEQYQGRGQDSKLTFKQILLNQLSRITSKMTVEWKGGYWQQKSIPAGSGLSVIEKYYIPDTRDEFINGVNCLHDLLISYFDDKMKDEVKEFEKKLKDKKDKDKTIDVYRYLFRALNKLLFRKRYLEAKTFEEEV